jgi:hypothetical protein
MKKVALSLATVLAAAAFAPEASAVPSFARQTGMACSACHFMKFPTLNGFGRAFKASGYTLMGAQGKVEGDHLSIPETLNASILLKYRYVKDGTNGAARAIDPADYGSAGRTGTTGGLVAGRTGPTATADGQWQMGDEVSLFFGGRIAESDLIKIGFLNENNMAGGNAAGGMLAGIRIPVVVDLGAVKVSAIPFTTDAHGVQLGYEMSSGGVLRANRWAEARREISAVQYNADRGSSGGVAAGHAFVVANDLFFVNYTKWSSSFGPGANGQGVASTNYGQSYIRAAVTPNVAGWDLMAGFGKESGTSYGNTVGAEVEANQTFIDFQAQGELAGMETGVYFQNAKAPVCTSLNIAAANCVHNTGTVERSATTIGGEVGVIPHALAVGLAYRSAKNGTATVTGGTTSYTDNAITVTAVYDLFQNVALHLDYIKYSGTESQRAGRATSRMLGMLEAAW